MWRVGELASNQTRIRIHIRQQRCHIRQIPRPRGTLQETSIDEATVDAPNIRIDHGHGLAESESGDSACGVTSDAGQGLQLGDAAGDLSTVALHTGDSALA